MTKHAILTKAFWADTLERTVSTAAQAVAAVIGADQIMDQLGSPASLQLDPKAIGMAAGVGALAALVKALAKLGLTAPVQTVEVVRPPTDDEIRKFLESQQTGLDEVE